jgi:hypothetical protein
MLNPPSIIVHEQLQQHGGITPAQMIALEKRNVAAAWAKGPLHCRLPLTLYPAEKMIGGSMMKKKMRGSNNKSCAWSLRTHRISKPAPVPMPIDSTLSGSQYPDDARQNERTNDESSG